MSSCTVSDTRSIPEVQELYTFLHSFPDEHIMFGHQDTLSYGIGWKYEDDPGSSDILRVCGDYPAIFGWDLGHIETGSPENIDGVPFLLMKELIQTAHEMGGIQTVSWHPSNPLTGGTTWDISQHVVDKILPGGKLEKKFEYWLQDIGTFLGNLTDSQGNPVPVIFRPFHEHTGSWFWWGNNLCSQNEFIELWKYTVSYLRDTMDVHNLLYCYSSDIITSADEYLYKYPGDRWVDLLGMDIYDFPHKGVDYAKVLPECLSVLSETAHKKNKPCALTETGNLCVKPADWWTESLLRNTRGRGICYFHVWINIEEAQYYGPFPGQVSAEDFKKFYHMPETVFLHDLKKMRTTI